MVLYPAIPGRHVSLEDSEIWYTSENSRLDIGVRVPPLRQLVGYPHAAQIIVAQEVFLDAAVLPVGLP
jgi:hypothetical protein